MQVTLHTKPNCQPCRLTKMKLDQLGITYTHEHLTPDSAERFRADDLLSAPVVEVDMGDGATWRWSGYRPSQIEELRASLTEEAPASEISRQGYLHGRSVTTG